MSHKKNKYMDGSKPVMIQSKITEDTSRRLDEIVKKFGFTSRYEILQYLISAFLHYADPTTPADEPLRMISGIFAGCENPRTRLNTLRSADGDAVVTDVIAVTRQRGSSACSCRWTHRDEHGEVESSSAAGVFDVILKNLLPARYDYLRKVAAEIDSVSVLYALDYLIEADRRCGTPDTAEYMTNIYGVVPVRHPHKTIDK